MNLDNRHCEERSDAAIQLFSALFSRSQAGLPRFARNDVCSARGVAPLTYFLPSRVGRPAAPGVAKTQMSGIQFLLGTKGELMGIRSFFGRVLLLVLHSARRALATGCLASCIIVPAVAAPATQAGADRLQHAIEGRLDPQFFKAGFFRIVPVGDHYDLIIDIATIPAAKASGFPKATLHMSPGQDGTYAFTSDPLSYAAANRSDATPSLERLENCTALGVFNPSQLFLSKLKLKCGRLSLRNDARAPKHYDISDGSLTWEGTPGIDGAADIMFRMDSSGLVEDFLDVSHAARPVFAQLRMGEARYQMDFSQAKAGDIAELYKTFHVGGMGAPHPTFDALKEKVKAALPLWNQLTVQLEAKDTRFSMAGFTATLPRYLGTETFSGVAQRSSAGMDIEISGATLAVNGRPGWQTTLFPSLVLLYLDVQNVDLAGFVAGILQQKSEDDAARWADMMAPAFLLSGSGDIVSSFGIRAPVYEVEGWANAKMDTSMRGKATFSAAGLEAALATLQKAKAPPSLSLVLVWLKGLGSHETDGRLSWDVTLDIPGHKVTVNGQSIDLSGL